VNNIQQFVSDAIHRCPERIIHRLRVHVERYIRVRMAVDRRAGIPKIDFTPVRIIRMSGAALSTGIDRQNIDGVRVRITSPARTVVDCFKFRNRIGIDVAVEALKDYRRLRKGTVDELWRQADRLRMSKVICPYWDAMSS
jgi:predicted transcriptional regulator of viral defense system